MRTAASCRSTRRRRAHCPACSPCGPRPTSPMCRRSISARARSRHSIRTASRSWQMARCAMSATRSPPYLRPTPTSPRTPPIWSKSKSRNCRRYWMRKRRCLSFLPDISASRPSSGRVTATSMPCSAPRRMWSSLNSPSAGIPACRWRRAARSVTTTPRGVFWSCTAPPRCRTAIRNCWPACCRFRRVRCMCTNPMSAAASAFAARCIQRIFSSASPPRNSIGR